MQSTRKYVIAKDFGFAFLRIPLSIYFTITNSCLLAVGNVVLLAHIRSVQFSSHAV